MAGAKTKLMVDQQGVTIAGDNFQLTTAGAATDPSVMAPDDVMFGVAESAEMETIISELEAMTRRTYGQFCGVSRALEVVGERWTLLIVRDLLVSPKRVADLQAGLPRIPTDILVSRLRELERVGVVRRMAGLPADEPVGYELTEYGVELDEIVMSIGRWGARLLGDPRPEEIVTVDSLIMAMRATFQRDMAAGVQVSYEMRVGDVVLNMLVDDGRLTVSPGPLPGADLCFEPGMVLKRLLTGELSAAEAIESGAVSMQGDPTLLDLFTRMFVIQGGESFD
jgi:DNA-binding HxlR family transcriptional regulator